jgi:membrane-bound ClpP family serine protease
MTRIIADLIEFAVYVAVALLVISWFLKVAMQDERFFLYTLGKFEGIRGPGLVMIVPFIQTIRRVKLRSLIGQTGTVKALVSPHDKGEVHVAGADWNAISEIGIIDEGKDIKVVNVTAQGLVIRPVDVIGQELLERI